MSIVLRLGNSRLRGTSRDMQLVEVALLRVLLKQVRGALLQLLIALILRCTSARFLLSLGAILRELGGVLALMIAGNMGRLAGFTILAPSVHHRLTRLGCQVASDVILVIHSGFAQFRLSTLATGSGLLLVLLGIVLGVEVRCDGT